ncbi:MAG: hypothetical protein AB8C46_09220 [Burkholderiaceae bacterium]
MIRKPTTHTLYLSAAGLQVVSIDDQGARVAHRFDLPESEGIAGEDLRNSADALAFQAWVESEPEALFQLLVDHVDEQHALESIPKLGLRDRAALINKRFNQQFRDSEFRTTNSLPKQPGDAKKEERIVMMALKSSVNFSPWLEILLASKARIGLITSPALLSSQLIKTIAPGQSGLLISHHPAGLRQTLMIDGTVRFSRLARLKAYDAPNVRAEVLRSIQYLTMTQRLDASLITKEKFTVWLIEDAISQASHLPASLTLDSGAPISIKRLGARQLGMPIVEDAEGVSIWASLCQLRPGPLSYTNRRVNVFHRLANWRKRLWTGAAITVSAGLLLALLTDQIVSWHGHRMHEVRAETSRLKARIGELRTELSQFPTTPEDLRAVVRISERLLANEASPVEVLDIISKAFVQTDGLTLTGMSFSAQAASLDDTSSSMSSGGRAGIGVAGGLSGSASATPSLLAHQMRITVTGLADRLLTRTEANNQIRQFADALAQRCDCSIVQTDLPFDASAQSGLTASLNDQFQQSREFRIIALRAQPATSGGFASVAGIGTANTQPGASDDLMSAMSVSSMEAERE